MAKNTTIESLIQELELGQQTPTEQQLLEQQEQNNVGVPTSQQAGTPISQTSVSEETGAPSTSDFPNLFGPPSDPFQQFGNVDDMPTAEEYVEYLSSLEESFPALRDTEKPTFETEALAVGRKLLIIPQSVYGSTKARYKRNSEPSNNFVFLETGDAFRGRSGNYWSINSLGTGVEYIRSEVLEHTPYNILYGQSAQISSDLTQYGVGTEQLIQLKPIQEKFKNGIDPNSDYVPDLWSAYVLGEQYTGDTSRGKIDELFSPTVDINRSFADHVHEMPLPFSRKELDRFSSPLNAMSAEIRPEYNFYIKSYETKIMEDSDVYENTLPNMYVFLSELNEEESNFEFRRFITLGGNLTTNQYAPSYNILYVPAKRVFDIRRHPIGQYYDIYARHYDKAKNTGETNFLNTKFSNLLVSTNQTSLLKEFNEKREMFPMYVDIQFSTDKATSFAQILKDSNLSDTFMTHMVNRISDNQASLMPCQEVTQDVIQEQNQNPIVLSSLSADRQKRFWNVSDIIENLMEEQPDILPGNRTYLGKQDNLNGKQYDFFKSIMFRIFRGKLKKLVKEKFRSFKNIMDGKPAYSETVFYRVAKYGSRAGVNGNFAMQNYYFPNSNELDVLRFIDTQVKYGKEYTYVVYAYQLVFGNKYKYGGGTKDVTFPHIEPNTAGFKVFNVPDLALFEHEFYRFSGRVLDDSPISPDVDIIPYKGKDDRVLITMNSNVGNFLQDPIVIKQEDSERVETFRQERQLEPGSPIRFKADDHASKFEVYRMEAHPESYSDFENNLRTIVDTESYSLSTVGCDTELFEYSSTSAAFVDEIKPNKKYYYIFRSIDVHDNFSNPTPIIRIEMISENGTVFLLKDVVDFAEVPKVPSKQARRYIQLVPTILQSLINEEKSGYEEALSASEVARKIHLGEVDESVWGKNFKIRLTSKSSGKKVDFFVKFEHENKEKC